MVTEKQSTLNDSLSDSYFKNHNDMLIQGEQAGKGRLLKSYMQISAQIDGH